ncbi:MAG: GGDEF domain-containing protein [Thermodesulfobacteriota bacterium]
MENRAARLLLSLLIILVMANISPLVDLVLRPEIPYFAPEHLITGAITAAITLLLIRRLLGYATRMGSLARQLNRLTCSLREQSIHDGLTGLYNHRHFQEMLRHEFLLAQRNRADLACMMLDLDHFKEVNDSCGHQFGDLVLKGTAIQILDETRRTDTVARYGGEEFAILLPNTDLSGALRIAERIRKRAGDYLHQNGSHTKRVTISIGVASTGIHHPENPEDLLLYADRALYLAKETGRDRVLPHR